MTNRTVQIKGYGFGSTPATISVTLDGNAIFSGEITTSNSAPPELPNLALVNDPVVLCTFELPVNFTGFKPMTCEVTNGSVIFAQITADYIIIPNPVYTAEDWTILNNPSSTKEEKLAVFSSHATPPFTAEEENTLLTTTDQAQADAILVLHGVQLNVSGGAGVFDNVGAADDPRNNVTIDGIAVSPDHGELPGTWWYLIDNGSTLSYDLDVVAGA